MIENGKRKRGRPVGTGHRILLRARDFELLRFINDMKFAPTSELFRLFFKQTFKGEIAKSDLWAKERLEHLRREGFLKKIRTFYEMQSYFLVTEMGVNTLRGHYLDEDIPNFIEGIDVRYSNHDLNILKCRVALEIEGRARDWECERRIRSRVMSEINAKFPTYRDRDYRERAKEAAKPLIPDGIYTNLKGDRVAFEFEENIKEPERYTKKLEGFLRQIRDQEVPFKRVLFVTSKVNVYSILEKLTRPYGGDVFRVNMAQTVLAEKKIKHPTPATVDPVLLAESKGDAHV